MLGCGVKHDCSKGTPRAVALSSSSSVSSFREDAVDMGTSNSLE